MYINDLDTTVPEPIQCGMFADDVALWSSIFTKYLFMGKYVENGSCSRKDAMHYFQKQEQEEIPPLQLNLDGIPITETDNVKYLGLIMDSQLTYQQHINYIYGKASRKLEYLTCLCSYKGIRPSLSVYTLLFKTIIRPSLEYACAFWNGASEVHKKKLERIQRIAICRILGVMHATAYDTVNVISQIPPLELRRQQEEVKIFQRCIKWSGRFYNHNLVKSYWMWEEHKTTTNMDRHVATPPMKVTTFPHSEKSPFAKSSEPTTDQILVSITDDCV
ncbi:hypothetical protein RFI_32751, partial [Reticulomyxa filosa]